MVDRQGFLVPRLHEWAEAEALLVPPCTHNLLVLDRMPIAISLLNAFLYRQFKTSKTTPKLNFIIP